MQKYANIYKHMQKSTNIYKHIRNMQKYIKILQFCKLFQKLYVPKNTLEALCICAIYCTTGTYIFRKYVKNQCPNCKTMVFLGPRRARENAKMCMHKTASFLQKGNMQKCNRNMQKYARNIYTYAKIYKHMQKYAKIYQKYAKSKYAKMCQKSPMHIFAYFPEAGYAKMLQKCARVSKL